MNKYLTIFLSAGALILTGCNEGKEFFEDERYIKQVYTVSDGGNIFHSEYNMNMDEGDGFSSRSLSYAISGSNPIDKDVTIEVEVKPELIKEYNESHFEDEAKYAKMLESEVYEIPSNVVKIEAGKNPQREYGLLNIKVKNESLERLSPDSTYLIGISIKDASPYPIIEEKKDALFRVYKKNKYATTRKNTMYTSNGYEGGSYFSGVQKRVHPVTAKGTRITVGNKVFSDQDTEEKIKLQSMVVIVNDDYTIDLSGYKDGLVIEKLIPSTNPTEASFYYDNTYDETGKTFRLFYRYSTDGGTTYSSDIMEMLTLDAI